MATTKKKSWLDTVAPLPTVIPPTPKPDTPITPPSKYKPQRYNKETGQVEDIDPKKQTRMSRAEFNRTPKISDAPEFQINAEIDKALLKKKLEAEREPPSNAASLIPQIGQLTPEQQVLANANAELSGRPAIGDILKTAGERAAIAGAGGAVTGAIGGSVVPGVGTLAGAGLVGLGAGAVAGVSAIFSEFKKKDKANYDTVTQNYDLAKANMNKAISLANSAAGDEANILAVQKYNEAIAQITLAERQLKELSKDQTKYINEIKDKQTEVIDFQNNVRPIMDASFARALQKPTATFISSGMQ